MAEQLVFEGYRQCRSVCDIQIEQGPPVPSASRMHLVTITERADNPGTSVTNAAETIATLIAARLPDIPVARIVFVEYYPKIEGRFLVDAWDEVSFQWLDRTAMYGPRWRPLGHNGYTELRRKMGIGDE